MFKLSEAEWLEWLDNTKYKEARKDYTERMMKEGFRIYYPEYNEITLDIDSEEDYQYFLSMYNRLKADKLPLFHDSTFIEQPSKSGLPNRHIIIRLNRSYILDDIERVAWQAVLGSDRVREMLSLFRIMGGDARPTLLAMLPEKEVEG